LRQQAATENDNIDVLGGNLAIFGCPFAVSITWLYTFIEFVMDENAALTVGVPTLSAIVPEICMFGYACHIAISVCRSLLQSRADTFSSSTWGRKPQLCH